MRALDAFKVDAFTDRPYAGNPAGVIPDAEGLTDAQMEAIAREMNLSETAFVLPPRAPGAHARLRYFTPTAEVPLCGHATVAAFHLLAELGRAARPSTLRVETNVGVLEVELRDDGRVFLQSDPLTVVPSPVPAEEAARLLGLPPEAVSRPRLVRDDAFVGVRGLKDLEATRPDLGGIAALATRGVQGLVAVSRETRDPGARTHIRYFVPAVGIPEDPVTGAAHMGLARYLLDAGEIDAPSSFVGEQGAFCGRPGTAFVEVRGTRDAPDVRVGGHAVTVLRGSMRAP